MQLPFLKEPWSKATFLNSNSIGDSRVTGLSVVECYVLPSLNKVDYFTTVESRFYEPPRETKIGSKNRRV